MVRSFFGAFSSGVIDGSVDGNVGRQSPKTVKQLMLNHYEHIAPSFLDIMFYPLAAMNFSYSEIEQTVKESRAAGDDMMALVRKACGDGGLYDAMVGEYKRNFSNLLAGRSASVSEHFESYTHGAGGGESAMVDGDKSIEFVVRVVMRAYVAGLKQTEGASGKFRQATLFRLLLDAMNVLLGDGAADYTDCGDDLAAMFMKVCRDEHNFSVMTAEMDRTHAEIVG